MNIKQEKSRIYCYLQKTFWLKNCSFANSYVQCKTHHTSKNPDKNAIVQAVWHDLSQYGITEEMLAESYPKAPRSAVVGTYRIVLYQTQIKAEEEERQRAMVC